MAAAAATMARAVLVAVVLMQYCNMIVTARPLLETPAVVAGGAAAGSSSWLGLIMQVLGGPGGNNTGCQAPTGSCP